MLQNRTELSLKACGIWDKGESPVEVIKAAPPWITVSECGVERKPPYIPPSHKVNANLAQVRRVRRRRWEDMWECGKGKFSFGSGTFSAWSLQSSCWRYPRRGGIAVRRFKSTTCLLTKVSRLDCHTRWNKQQRMIKQVDAWLSLLVSKQQQGCLSSKRLWRQLCTHSHFGLCSPSSHIYKTELVLSGFTCNCDLHAIIDQDSWAPPLPSGMCWVW